MIALCVAFGYPLFVYTVQTSQEDHEEGTALMKPTAKTSLERTTTWRVRLVYELGQLTICKLRG
jgi:hypothetical protein